MFNQEILMQAIMESRDSITIADATIPNYPLIFVNPAFETLTGYSKEEILLKNCRYLQGTDRDQRQLKILQEAIHQQRSCLMTIRNYRKDGSMFWNELSISPVFEKSGLLTHFIGIQKDVTARVILEHRLIEERKLLEQSKATLEKLIIYDTLTGIYNRRYFEDQFYSFWEYQADAKGHLAVMFIDIDYFKLFNDTYGHIAGDEALKKVATTLHGSLRRSSDFVARYGGEEFIVLASEMSENQAISYAQNICMKIRELEVPHATSPHGFLTISCGVACFKPNINKAPKQLLHQADLALYRAKEMGRNQAAAFDSSMQPKKL